jgi:PAS domain S-box-containing protein
MGNREGGASSDASADVSLDGAGRGEDSVLARPFRREPVIWLLAVLAVVLLAYVGIWAAKLGDPGLVGRFAGAMALPASLLTIVLTIRLRRSSWLDDETRRGWTFLSVAFCSYFAGAICNFVGTTIPAASFLTYLAPVLEVAAYSLWAVALAMLPKAWRSRSDAVVFGLDVAIVTWSAAMLLWHFLLFPIGREAGAQPVATIAAAAYPVADLAFIFAVGAILMRGLRPSSQHALVPILAALLLAFAGDTISGIESLQGQYTPGGLSGVIYSTAWLGLALAAYLQTRPDDGPRRVSAKAASYSFWLLPYLAVAVAFLAPAIRDWDDLELLRQHVPATGLLIALVVARLGVTAWQNAGLATAERERLATAVEQASESILMADADGMITYVNPAFTRITGYPSVEAVGRHATFLTEGAAGSERLEEIRGAFARGEVWGGRLRYQRKDDAPVDVDLAVSPLRDASGTVVGSVEVARDISRETALEVQLAEAHRMEAIGRLAGGIAHDFNNILTAISGFAELAADELPDDHPVAEDLTQILQASDRAAALTQALLAFSRRQVMQPSVLDLNDVVTGISPMLGRLIGEDVELVVRTDPTLGRTMADRARFEQVLMNLAVNARDAMPNGGRLTIETANVDLDAEYVRTHVGAKAGPHVMLAVFDTGVGMAAQVLKHAFEPFFTTKAQGKGTGLGLSTVIGIVAQSGGSIDVHSEPGHGAAFRIYLPRVEAQPEAGQTARRGSDSPIGNETILVAEDEPAVRTFVERVLSHAGYQVHTAANGEEALRLAATLDRLDLLFTDMVMPGMGGPELIEALTAERPHLRTICASGYTDNAVFRDGAAISQRPYLSKPFTAEALLALVRQVLDGPASPPILG